MIRTRFGRDHGYLFIDHTFSPGVSEEQARQAGYDPRQVREGKRFETKTLCCAHCRTHVVPAPTRKIERASCPKCNWHYICDGCAFLASQPDYVHTPFERKVELALSGQPQGTPPKLLTP
jgi:hypothetical protein